MHIHNQPMNLYMTNIQSPATSAAQQAAEVRRRLAKAAEGISGEADSFQSFMIGEPKDHASQGQRNRDSRNPAKALHADAENESIGRNLSVSA
jgi:hypothetical protein